MTAAKGDFKFLIRNVKDVIYKDFIIKRNPTLQIELAKMIETCTNVLLQMDLEIVVHKLLENIVYFENI
jgi:hypothetical protein